jgi:ApaG protein
MQPTTIDNNAEQTLEKHIHISVESKFEPSQSDIDANRYVFSYTITIKNTAPFNIQLLSRRWVVTDGNEKRQEIQGEGVIGKQPVIEPNTSYQYSSGTVLETNVGSMFGHYNMVSADGVSFKAQIAPFTLAKPNALH